MSLSDRMARLAQWQRQEFRSEERVSTPAPPFDMEKFQQIFAEIMYGDAPPDEYARIEQEMAAAFRAFGRG